jgi:hypothetical protein
VGVGGAGLRLTCAVVAASKAELQLSVVEVCREPESQPRFVLVQAIAQPLTVVVMLGMGAIEGTASWAVVVGGGAVVAAATVLLLAAGRSASAARR